MSQVNFAFLLIYYEFYFAAVRAQPALPRTGVFGMRNPRRRAPFRITPAGIRSSSALRNACVSWAVEFGEARGRPNGRPQRIRSC